ncbi:heavy metal translocatin [Tothia fuscella]|uniref:Heavy metal translocatin n=1 Tax=Tothia fuscella TaxID=1048955 RepID=A0A9P4P2W3_9PEZI|nr:heavy metal translocatin [Tothia fuscella]
MACCIFVAFCMNRIIKACEVLDLQLIHIKYNDFDTPYESATLTKNGATSTRTLRVSIDGMTCAACGQTIKNALLKIDGVRRVSVSLPLARATVVFDSDLLPPSRLEDAVRDAGYGAKVGDRSVEENQELLSQSKHLASLKIAFSSAASLSSVIVVIDAAPTWLREDTEPALFVARVLLASWVIFYDSRWIHKGAWARGRMILGMDTLISLSLLLGMFLSFFNISLRGWRQAQTYFSSGCFLATVITTGRYLDLILRRRSTSNFSFLYRLQSETTMAYVRSDETFVPAATLNKGDEIVIEPMSIIPVDCFILEGNTVVDEATMTGESFPPSKTIGSFLMSGTRNISSRIIAVVIAEQHESSLERLIENISGATEERGDASASVDSLVRHFVAGILFLALLGFARSFFIFQGPVLDRFNIAAQRAMVILAASCPCALGLAGPSASMAGLDAAWAHGILLVGGARILESLDRISTCVMDKTGTLTEGLLRVDSCHFEDDVDAILCYQLLFLAEKEIAQSNPAGKAVFQFALQQLKLADAKVGAVAEVEDYCYVPGQGVSCVVRTPDATCHSVFVGSRSFLTRSDILLNTFSHSESMSEINEVLFAMNGRFAGRLFLHDKLRDEAPCVIRGLKAMGLGVTMLTGDTHDQASRISSLLDIPVLSARSLPHEKQAHVQTLQQSGEKIAMIGDGVNDSLAQAAADVGILLSLNRACMTGAADVVIMSPSLEAVPKLFEIARLSVKQARWNTKWAIGYNVVAISLASGIFEQWGVAIDASIAGTLMACSSLTVLGMSLHLRQRLS